MNKKKRHPENVVLLILSEIIKYFSYFILSSLISVHGAGMGPERHQTEK